MFEMQNRQSDVSYSFLGTKEDDDDEDEIIPVRTSSSQFFKQNLSQQKNQLNSCISIR